jgi:hypothetical protein
MRVVAVPCTSVLRTLYIVLLGIPWYSHDRIVRHEHRVDRPYAAITGSSRRPLSITPPPRTRDPS